MAGGLGTDDDDHSDYSGNSDLEEDIVDNPEEVAVNEVMIQVRRFLRDPKEEEDSLKAKLLHLGAINVSRLHAMEPKDLDTLMSIGGYREWKKTSVNPEEDKSGKKAVLKTMEQILTTDLLNLLKRPVMLDGHFRTLVVELVGFHFSTFSKFKGHFITNFCRQCCKEWPMAFGGIAKPDGNQLELITTQLVTNIRHHYYYLRRLEIKGRRVRAGTTPMGRKFSKAESYGLVQERDVPLHYPEDASSTDQEKWRSDLQEMYSRGEKVMQDIRRKMRKCYELQRHDISMCEKPADLLKLWPFIGLDSVIQAHFEDLMKVNRQQLRLTAEEKVPLWMKFFCLKVSEGTKKGGRIPKGSVAEKLNTLLDTYRELDDDDIDLKILVTIVGIATYKRLASERLFWEFEESETLDEIEASDEIPDGPFIAVLGKCVLSSKAYVVAGKRCIFQEPVAMPTALLIMLEGCFVFKWAYNHQWSAALEFLEKDLYCIPQTEGSRIARPQTPKGNGHAAPTLSAKYASLKHEFQQLLPAIMRLMNV